MDEQSPPKGDARYRVHRSVKCYIGEYIGRAPGLGTWYIQDSAERVVYQSSKGHELVQYKNRFYRLQSSEDLVKLAKEHWSYKGQGPVIVGGRPIYAHQRRKAFDAFPFIVVYNEAADNE